MSEQHIKDQYGRTKQLMEEPRRVFTFHQIIEVCRFYPLIWLETA